MMEKEEKKQQLVWMVPIILQRMYISGPQGQQRHAEGAEQDVQDGQGGDEHISGGQHHLQKEINITISYQFNIVNPLILALMLRPSNSDQQIRVFAVSY